MTKLPKPLPRQRLKPRRTKHPIQPAWADPDQGRELSAAERQQRQEEAAYMAAAVRTGCALNSDWSRECTGRITFQHPQGLRYRGLGAKGPVLQGCALCEGHHLFGHHSIEYMGIRDWERKYGTQEVHAETTRHRLRKTGFKFKES